MHDNLFGRIVSPTVQSGCWQSKGTMSRPPRIPSPQSEPVEAAGIISRAVPMEISAANPKIEMRAGDRNRARRENMIDIYFSLSSSWAKALNNPRGDELIDSF